MLSNLMEHFAQDLSGVVCGQEMSATVKDQGWESPVGLFINVSGVVRDVMNRPFHKVSPCPNLALKSPASSCPSLLRNFQAKLPEISDGYHD